MVFGTDKVNENTRKCAYAGRFSLDLTGIDFQRQFSIFVRSTVLSNTCYTPEGKTA
jgi:hypothetical protein